MLKLLTAAVSRRRQQKQQRERERERERNTLHCLALYALDRRLKWGLHHVYSPLPQMEAFKMAFNCRHGLNITADKSKTPYIGYMYFQYNVRHTVNGLGLHEIMIRKLLTIPVLSRLTIRITVLLSSM